MKNGAEHHTTTSLAEASRRQWAAQPLTEGAPKLCGAAAGIYKHNYSRIEFKC